MNIISSNVTGTYCIEIKTNAHNENSAMISKANRKKKQFDSQNQFTIYTLSNVFEISFEMSVVAKPKFNTNISIHLYAVHSFPTFFHVLIFS